MPDRRCFDGGDGSVCKEGTTPGRDPAHPEIEVRRRAYYCTPQAGRPSLTPQTGPGAGQGPGASAGSPPKRVRIKICGVSTPAGAALAAELGADYIGLNFWAGSPRRVGVEQAREIASAAGGRVARVGVFVDSPAAEIERIVEEVGLDLVQFSGHEGAAEVAPFAARAIKAFRTGGDPGGAALADFAAVWGWLFDAPHATLMGGTGEAWDWARVPDAAAAGRAAAGRGAAGEAAAGRGAVGPRLFLAGGIGPGNVRRALAACRPFALDVCSRVESAPGIKDPGLLRRLFEEVRDGEAPRAPA
jgi:phosphoribosylanthranilate isomerase